MRRPTWRRPRANSTASQRSVTFGDPQTVEIGDQDHGGIAKTIAVRAGGLEQPIHLGVGQVLA